MDQKAEEADPDRVGGLDPIFAGINPGALCPSMARISQCLLRPFCVPETHLAG